MKNLLKLSFLFLLVGMLSCTTQNKTSGYYKFETECYGVELDGSQTLKAWGRGKNRKDAVEQAKKNAVNDVLFTGIRKGVSGCEVRPLIIEVRAKEKYEDYFYTFFEDGGLYKEFVTNDDASLKKDKHAAGSDVVYGVVVRVLRHKLKKQLIEDQILKQ